MGVEENTKGTMPGGGGPNTPSPEGKTPEGASKVSPEPPKTYTKESEEMAVHQALSDAGRVSTDTTEAERILTDAKATRDALQAEREQWQKDKDEADREAVKDDPEALKSLQERQRQRNEATKLASGKTELATEKATHDAKVKADLEQIRVFNRTQLAAEVAVATGVSLDIILKHAKDDSREAMEAVANDFKEAKPSLKTDSSTTLGGGASWEEVRAAYIKNPNNQAVYERYMEMRKERERNR